MPVIQAQENAGLIQTTAKPYLEDGLFHNYMIIKSN